MIEDYLKAGKIASDALKKAFNIVYEEKNILDICEELEDFIIKQGGFPAFPVNISQNEEAAHYTAKFEDDKKIKRGAIVKVDLGVHVNGYIADTAITITFSGVDSSMVKANQETLEKSLKIVRNGLDFYEFGAFVEKNAKSYGFKTIENLMGHKLERYVLHAGLSIPMISSPIKGHFEKNNAYAIEPFFVESSAIGFVVDGEHSNIYRLVSPRRLKGDETSAQIVSFIWEKYKTLPFASRWIAKEFGKSSIQTLGKLVKEGILDDYHVLIEAGGARVSQFEHTVFVTDKETLVTTKL